MPGFFDVCTQNTCTPFVLFGAQHLAALAVIVFVNVFLVIFGRKAGELGRRRIRLTIGWILIVNEFGWHLWNLLTGQWTLGTMLPLHLCSALVWLEGFMLITGKGAKWIYEFAYLLGIAGALQAILTPDLGLYNFPQYRYWQTFISHGLLVTAPIYLTLVEGYRPTWRSILRVGLYGNAYMVVVYLINLLVGGNFLYIAHKPATASLMDVLPAWPWYIPIIELIALFAMLLMYTPFVIRDRVKAGK